jgi:hypothetical protein
MAQLLSTQETLAKRAAMTYIAVVGVGTFLGLLILAEGNIIEI